MRNPKIFFVDLDDTLIDTSICYIKADMECLKYIYRKLGCASPPVEHILNIRKTHQKHLVKKCGFHKDVFPKAWSFTMSEIGGDGASWLEIEKIANGFHQGVNYKLKSGATELIRIIRNIGSIFVIYTMGSVEIQMKKIIHTGLEKLAHDIVIVPMKSNEILRNILLKPAEEYVVIGDSLKYDIHPAVEVGIHNIIHLKNPYPCFHDIEIQEIPGRHIYSQSLNLEGVSDNVRRILNV